jgi:hypothetical protein
MLCALIIATHMGGSISDATAVARWADKSGCIVRIEGQCASACVMLVKLGCVTPSAMLGFHAPTRNGMPLVGSDRAFWAQRMASHMPAAMARWYLAGPAYKAGLTWLDARNAIIMGAKPCRL